MRSPRPIGLLDHRAAAAAAYRLHGSEHAAVGEQLEPAAAPISLVVENR
jgi:hypothetical protein